MSNSEPIVYILHGEDEFKITQEVASQEARLIDLAYASLNIMRLDGRSFQMDELLSIAGALPFLAKRRLVILIHPLEKLKSEEARQRFLRQLEQIPASTALFLVEYRPLSKKEGKKPTKHFLEEWVEKNPNRAVIMEFQLPKGQAWCERVQEIARDAGGQISADAATRLYELLDGDPRLAHQEVLKLLAYVNYRRPVDVDDVHAVTADVGQGNIFEMVDAVGNRDARKAMRMLQRLLEYQDYYSIFGMVVRQFRMLIQTRETLDNGGRLDDVIKALKSKYLAEKMIGQARRFSLEDLKRIYRRLLETDEAVKTSQMPDELALQVLVASLTT